MNRRINDIDSVRWRVSVVICIVFDEYRYADVLLLVTLRIYSSVLILIRRTSSVCLAEMMSIRKEIIISTWTLRDRRTPSWQWSRSSGICDPLFVFHSRGLIRRITNSRSRVKFEWSDLWESTDQKRKFSSYNENIYFNIRISVCICSIETSEENDRIISKIIVKISQNDHFFVSKFFILSLLSKNIHLLLKKETYYSIHWSEETRLHRYPVMWTVWRHIFKIILRRYFFIKYHWDSKTNYLDMWLNPRHDTYRHEVLKRNELSLSTTKKRIESPTSRSSMITIARKRFRLLFTS